jgi:hypothetical protein
MVPHNDIAFHIKPYDIKSMTFDGLRTILVIDQSTVPVYVQETPEEIKRLIKEVMK